MDGLRHLSRMVSAFNLKKKQDSEKSNFKTTLKEFNRTQIAFPHTSHIPTSVVWQRGASGIMGAIGGIAVG